MGSRQAVLLTPSKSSGTARLLSPLESTLIEVLILKSFKFFRMNTYEKYRGEGVLLLTRFRMRESVMRSIATKDLCTHPMRIAVLPAPSFSGSESAAADESKDLSSHPMRESVLRSIATKDPSAHPVRIAVLPAPSFSGSESAAADESEDLSSHEESSFNQALRPIEPLFHRSPACSEPAVVARMPSHP